MKSSKKLIPAICLLLISAVLLGTSTYAWFTMNTTVSANGMEVSAVVPKSLVISTEQDGSYSAAVDLGMDEAQKLYPVSTTNAKNWYAPENLLNNNVDPVTGGANLTPTDENATKFQTLNNFGADGLLKDAGAGEEVYAVKKTVYVKSAEAGNEVYGLYVSTLKINDKAQANAANEHISKALRVAVVCGSKTIIFAPTGFDGSCQPIASLTPITGGSGGGETGVAGSATVVDVADVGNTHGVLIENTTPVSTTGQQIDIFIWYEGQDSNANNTNAINVEELSIEIGFTSSLENGSWS